MRAYRAYLVAGFRRWSTYRMATAAGAFTNSIFGLVKANITLAVIAAAGGRVGGYDAGAAATYAWVAQALIGPVSVFAWTEIADRVRTGDIAIDLARPVDLQLSYLAADLGRAAFVALPRGVPPLLVGAVTTGLALPGQPLAYALGLFSVGLAVAVSFACRFAVNLLSFWLLDLRGPLTLYMVSVGVLSGLVVPTHWFPGWLSALAAATPFPSMLQAPIDVLTGRVAGSGAVATVALQAAWLVAMLLLGRLLLAQATRRLVVQGG